MGDRPEAEAVPLSSVRVEVPDPGAAMGFGAEVPDAPAGRPETERVIAALWPFSPAVVMVVGPDAPCATVTDVGDAEIEKSGPPVKME